MTSTGRMNLIINSDVCTGCRLCELVCSLVKAGECNPAKARIHNETYLMEGMRVPRVCINCDEPACAQACAWGAIIKEEDTGRVRLDSDYCQDCGLCVEACPYGAISRAPDGEIIKCDLCGGNPQCVRLCETGAIQFKERQPQRLTWARQGTKSYLDKEKVLES